MRAPLLALTFLSLGCGSTVVLSPTADGGLTPTDIGADAGLFLGIDLAAPAISYTPLANTSQTTHRSLVVTIEDTTGVAAAGLSPRVYYRKGAGTYFSQPCSLSSGTAQSGTWTCPIVHSDLGGVVATDVVSYFVIAQDTLGNVSSSPSGAVATDVNTVTAPPATPSSYLISVQYSGSYNVGTGETFTSLTYAATATTRIKFGTLVASMTFRPPAMVARMAAGIDSLSGGRLILGIGGGWNQPEHDAFGIELPEPKRRLDMLEEGAIVIKSLAGQTSPKQPFWHCR